MHIAIDIPDNIAGVIAPDQDPARAALEALALEGYRSDRLSEYDLKLLLGFETRMEVHAFLKEHGDVVSVSDLWHPLQKRILNLYHSESGRLDLRSHDLRTDLVKLELLFARKRAVLRWAEALFFSRPLTRQSTTTPSRVGSTGRPHRAGR